MIRQYRNGVIPRGPANHISEEAAATITRIRQAFDKFEFSKGLEEVWSLISAVDKFIVQQAPWKQVKSAPPESLDETLYTAAEALRIATALLAPVLPESTRKIWTQLGMTTPLDAVRLDSLQWGGLQPGQAIGEVAAVFPRLDAKEAIDKACDF